MMIEPRGILSGNDAKEALEAGSALPLPDKRAFTSGCKIEAGSLSAPRAVTNFPEDWRSAAIALAKPPKNWADLPDHPLVMGVLNITPDSFSNGGLYEDATAAIEAGWRMAEQGADILDIGGESTKPGAEPVSAAEEQARILPIIAALHDIGVPISVDTRNADTMRKSIEAGARIINDVSGLNHDPNAAATVAAFGCPVILMHMRGTPQTMNDLTSYDAAPFQVFQELRTTLANAEMAGIAPEKIAIDPGLGFAKDCFANIDILQRLPLFLGLNRRILIGASRKRFIGTLAEEAIPSNRDPGSLAAHLFALSRGASILRTHEVKNTVQAVRVWNAIAA